MIQTNSFTFRSFNGINDICCQQWIPEGNIRGIVQIVHGIAEYIGRYNDFAAFLAEHNFLAVGTDHLGHGKSIADLSELGWTCEKNGWTYMVQDEKLLRDQLREKYPDLPFILLGHSMGSFIARTYLGWYPDDFDMCILSGTGYHSQIVCQTGIMLAKADILIHGSKHRSKFLQNLAFGGYLKKIDNPTSEHDWLCSVKEIVAKYDADPLCNFNATAALMRDMMTGLSIICRKSHMAKMKKDLPVLFIAGEDDPVGSLGEGVRKTVSCFSAAGMNHLNTIIYPNGRHEVLNEVFKQQVWNDILSWISEGN